MVLRSDPMPHLEAPRETIRIDLRVGGRWELTMVGRGGGGEFSIG